MGELRWCPRCAPSSALGSLRARTAVALKPKAGIFQEVWAFRASEAVLCQCPQSSEALRRWWAWRSLRPSFTVEFPALHLSTHWPSWVTSFSADQGMGWRGYLHLNMTERSTWPRRAPQSRQPGVRVALLVRARAGVHLPLTAASGSRPLQGPLSTCTLVAQPGSQDLLSRPLGEALGEEVRQRPEPWHLRRVLGTARRRQRKPWWARLRVPCRAAASQGRA